MKKFNFYCVDCNCANKNAGHKNQTFVIELTDEEKEENDVVCPNNSENVLKCLGYTPGWSHNKFDSMSSDQKQAVLLKRSKNHFKKEISEQKYEKNKQLIKKFQG
jgi:hypothetical protein